MSKKDVEQQKQPHYITFTTGMHSLQRSINNSHNQGYRLERVIHSHNEMGDIMEYPVFLVVMALDTPADRIATELEHMMNNGLGVVTS